MTILLAASAGGHLTQLLHLRPRLPIAGESCVWVTYDTPQSRSALAGEDVIYAEYAKPRDVVAVLRTATQAWSVLRRVRPSFAVSTGSSIALAYLPIAAALGADTHYVESATRIDGPSMTGRVLEVAPRVHLHNQHRTWGGRRWHYAGSVFDGFRAVERDGPIDVRRLVVTVGSSESYGFRGLLDALVRVVPATVDTLWQTGSSDVTGLAVEATPYLASHDLAAAMTEADVVVAHAGTGSALAALEAGKRPILVPRRAARGEHIDDHQAEIAADLAARGLADAVELDKLDWATIVRAAGYAVERADAPPLDLGR